MPWAVPRHAIWITLAFTVGSIGCRGDDGTIVADQRLPNPDCTAFPRPHSPIELERVFAHLELREPVQLALTPDGAWWYVIERAGRVLRFSADPDAAELEVVLDLTPHVDSGGDNGLVGLALHPAFESTGELFVSYTRPGTTALLESRISRFRSTDGGASFDPDGERVVLALEQTTNIHVNADLQFGPDGYLYAGFGDGAEQGDPDGYAQDPGRWTGKILRLDVDVDVDGDAPYAIPPDNPFAAGGGAPEVWAYGLRNPWRFTFDRETGELWAGDVGWGLAEEIDLVVGGGNYGWNVLEGDACWLGERCADAGMIAPALVMGRDQARSITAGYVYRGTRIPALRGRLVFGDFVTGFLWSFDPASGAAPHVLSTDGRATVSFAEDREGELYLVDLIGGSIWRLAPNHVPGGGDAPLDAPPTLTATGCFGPDGAPADALVPYALNWPFYSDGATKRRWIAIPDDTQIRVDDDGDLEFPIGTVLIKEFSFGGERVETRLLVRHDDGDWAGYTYAWRGDGSDAVLMSPAADPLQARGEGYWYYPRRPECLTCHNEQVGRAIGPKIGQLNGDLEYPSGRRMNQLEMLQQLGMLDARLRSPRLLPALPSSADPTVPVAQRARAWLHGNCAHCHRAAAMGNGDLDLRFWGALATTGICDEPPRQGTLDLPDARIVAPGDPARSVLLARLRDRGIDAMPPKAGLLLDHDGIALVEAWIAGLAGCAE